MVEHTNPNERAVAAPDRGKGLLRSIAARLGNVRSPEGEAGSTDPDARTTGAERLPEAQAGRRSVARSSMDAGITGGLTLFGMRRNGR